MARKAHNPSIRRWKAALKIVSSLRGTKHLEITYVWGSGLDLSVYTDAGCVDKVNDRRSFFGDRGNSRRCCCKLGEHHAEMRNFVER